MAFLRVLLLLSIQYCSSVVATDIRYENSTRSNITVDEIISADTTQTTTFDTTITSTSTLTASLDVGATVTNGNNTYVQTYLAPTAFGTLYTWSQYITPAILGTVFVIVNGTQTRTSTSTDASALASGTNTQYFRNGTLSLLTRTDVDADRTVTADFVTPGGSATVAYPTPYLAVSESIEYNGLFSSAMDGINCCVHTESYAATPVSHSAFPTSTGSTDSADPTGWLYKIVPSPSIIRYVGPARVSALFAPAEIPGVLQFCPYDVCNVNKTEVSPIDSVSTVGALLKTRTVSVTPAPSLPPSPAATSEQVGQTLEPANSGVFAEPDMVTSDSPQPTLVSLGDSAVSPEETAPTTATSADPLIPPPMAPTESAERKSIPTVLGIRSTIIMTRPAINSNTGSGVSPGATTAQSFARGPSLAVDSDQASPSARTSFFGGSGPVSHSSSDSTISKDRMGEYIWSGLGGRSSSSVTAATMTSPSTTNAKSTESPSSTSTPSTIISGTATSSPPEVQTTSGTKRTGFGSLCILVGLAVGLAVAA